MSDAEPALKESVADSGDANTRKVEVEVRIGPLKIRSLAIRVILSALTLDLVRGVPKPSPPDEPKLDVEVTFGTSVSRITESREVVSAYLLDLIREYPDIAATQEARDRTGHDQSTRRSEIDR